MGGPADVNGELGSKGGEGKDGILEFGGYVVTDLGVVLDKLKIHGREHLIEDVMTGGHPVPGRVPILGQGLTIPAQEEFAPIVGYLVTGEGRLDFAIDQVGEGKGHLGPGNLGGSFDLEPVGVDPGDHTL